jgi:dTDP-4-dehydrorhamnose reductase
MRVLITGVTGLLGRYLCLTQRPRDEIYGLTRSARVPELDGLCSIHQADVADFAALDQLLEEIRPDVIIHAAAEGSVDSVEGRISVYRRLNVEVGVKLASYSAGKGIQFVLVSSNAVFGGSPRRYSDISPVDPINDYGRLKAEAEGAALLVYPATFIPRPILMYGWPLAGQRANPPVAWVARLRSELGIRVVDDVWTEPLAAWDCAESIWSGIERGVAGLVNVSGGVRISLLEFAQMTAATFSLDSELVVGISSSDLEGLAPRPQETMFDLHRLKSELDMTPVGPFIGLARLRESEVSLGLAAE